MATAYLKLTDFVNCKFYELDPHTRRDIVQELKYFIPGARYTPAYKLGRWDGTMSFANVSGATYINLLDRVIPIVERHGYEIELIDERPQIEFEFPVCTEDLLADTLWPVGHPMEGKPIMLRDYQVKAINTFFENPRSMQSISTGAGKTIITGAISKLCEQFGRTLIIVPSKSLVTQTEEDYRNIGLDTGVYYGDRKEVGRTHTISTWQSLLSLCKKEEGEYSIEDFLEGVVAVVVDEGHTGKGDQLMTMLGTYMAHIPIRWGLTGTIPKEELDRVKLLTTLGPVVGEVTAKELQEKGVLSQLHINAIEMQDGEVEFPSYIKEKEYLLGDKVRLATIGAIIEGMTEEGNTLVLVERIETGRMLEQLIPNSVFIHGDTKNADRKDEFDIINTSDNKVLIASYGIASTGINIPRIFNLVLLEPGKSFVRVIQSIGRGIRKAKDKDFVHVWDIMSNLKYSKKHFKERRKFYKDAQYPCTVDKMDYR